MFVQLSSAEVSSLLVQELWLIATDVRMGCPSGEISPCSGSSTSSRSRTSERMSSVAVCLDGQVVRDLVRAEVEGTNDFGMEVFHRGGSKGIMEVLQKGNANLRGGVQQEGISAANRNQRERVSLLSHRVQQKERIRAVSAASLPQDIGVQYCEASLRKLHMYLTP